MHTRHRLPMGNLLDDAREAALDYYTGELRQFAPQLKRSGKKAAKTLITAITTRSDDKPGLVEGLPGWAERLAEPIVGPYIEGVMEEVTPLLLKKVGLVAGGAAGLGFLGGYLIGRK